MTAAPRIVPWTAALQPAYARFAAAHFGARAFQGRRELVAWLQARGGDVLLAVAGDEVVGCLHRMRMPWTDGANERDVVALVNLMVAPAHRTGTGLRLFAAGFGRERCAFVPAANDASAEMCARLGWRELPARWYRRLLVPGVPQIVTAVAGARSLVSRLRAPDGYTLFSSPPSSVLEAVAATLRAAPAGTLRPAWDADLVAWRFFRAGAGPRHVLLGRPPWTELAIVSIGPRRHLAMGRIVELRGPEPARLAQAAATVLARAGAHLVTLVTSDAATQAALAAAGWRGPSSPPRAFVFEKRRNERAERFSVSGGAGDFGLESFVAR